MRKIAFLVILFLAAFVFVPQQASAKVITMENGTVEIAKDEVINDDLFVFAENIDIEGTVNGDVYLGAGNVRVNGVINGDLHVGTGTFSLSGKVREDVYVGAGNVSLNNADIGDSLIVGSGNIYIDKDSSIGGSLIAGGGSINLSAPVKRNVMLGAGTVAINSSIGGEARLGGGEISLGPDTKIAKDLTYALGEEGNEITMSENASVSGMVQKVENKYISKKDLESARAGTMAAFRSLDIFMKFVSLIGAFIIGFICLKLFPKPFNQSADFVSKSFLTSLSVGFLITAAAIPVLLILVITVIGLPLAGLLFLILILNIYLSKIVVALALGKLISEKFNWKKMSIYGMLALGLFLVYVLKIIPVFRIFFSLAVLWTGLGALALYYKSVLWHK